MVSCVASIMAIVSKAVFEKAAGKSPNVGDVLRMDRYVSANKALSSLGDGNGGKLYMITVRPPNEALWLVGVLDNPKFDGTQWQASSPSPVPIVDISALKTQLKFETGKGITAAPGALGMSLQTPRILSAHDIELLDAASGAAAIAAAPPPLETTGERNQTDALLEALLADPTGDDPRRVIADALLAKNDPRGEFITLELALAGPLGIRRREELAKRHAELLAKHDKTWFATQLEHRRDRGFIASIKGTVKKLVAEAALFDSQPIVEVHVTNLDAKSLKQLLDAPWLARACITSRSRASSAMPAGKRWSARRKRSSSSTSTCSAARSRRRASARSPAICRACGRSCSPRTRSATPASPRYAAGNRSPICRRCTRRAVA